MRRCSVNSSDLARARELSLLLAQPGLRQRIEPLPQVVRVPVHVEAASAVTSRPEPPPVVDLHAAPLELESWETFLAWSLELCRARAGFVVDPQGFVVATRGNVPANQFEGLGAEMAYAMEQLDRIDAESGSLLTLELQFASRRLLAVRVARNGSGSFVIGFVGARPLTDEVRAAIMRQLAHSVDRLC